MMGNYPIEGVWSIDGCHTYNWELTIFAEFFIFYWKMGVWQPHFEYFKISTRQFKYFKSQYIFKVHCDNSMPKTILCVQRV
jgi:hypothetical protein